MKILITGAGGFLGQYLARQLATQHEVHALQRQQLDLTNTQSVHEHFQQNFYDAVIHCAAAGRNTPMVEDSNVFNNNIAAALNLLRYRDCYDQLINIGTGAEFDASQDIDQVNESDIFHRHPTHSYGSSKNIIARYLCEQPNCITLRLFGCFDHTEEDRRLLKKFHHTVSAGNQFVIQDRFFDMISAEDFLVVVRAVLNKQITEQNINCVYAQKARLSEILSVYCDKHGLDRSLIVVAGQGLNYTGNGSVLSKYNLNFQGLEQSLANYET